MVMSDIRIWEANKLTFLTLGAISRELPDEFSIFYTNELVVIIIVRGKS